MRTRPILVAPTGEMWFDEDGDGIRDGIEDPLEGVEVRLLDPRANC